MCKGLSIDDVREGVEGHTVFQEIRPGVGFETGDFVKQKLGEGATVERLTCVLTSVVLVGVRSSSAGETVQEPVCDYGLDCTQR